MRCQRNSIDTVVSRLLQYKAIQARDTLTRPRIKEIIGGMVSGGLLIAEIGPRPIPYITPPYQSFVIFIYMC